MSSVFVLTDPEQLGRENPLLRRRTVSCTTSSGAQAMFHSSFVTRIFCIGTLRMNIPEIQERADNILRPGIPVLHTVLTRL